MMRAKINPGGWPPEMDMGNTRGEIAAAYGMTVGAFNRQATQFLQCEGYDEEGNEYNDLHEWLTKEYAPWRDNTPWQKGDDHES
uniref:Uncharacterized protein n=1 Tax=viral metagenome TaxID=1070528 RepID=A0A6M3JMW4_9ZZZZ